MCCGCSQFDSGGQQNQILLESNNLRPRPAPRYRALLIEHRPRYVTTETQIVSQILIVASACMCQSRSSHKQAPRVATAARKDLRRDNPLGDSCTCLCMHPACSGGHQQAHSRVRQHVGLKRVLSPTSARATAQNSEASHKHGSECQTSKHSQSKRVRTNRVQRGLAHLARRSHATASKAADAHSGNTHATHCHGCAALMPRRSPAEQLAPSAAAHASEAVKARTAGTCL